MSSEKKKALKQARESLAAKEYGDVLSACKTVLKEDRSCYEAYLYIGKAAYHLGEYDQAELSYQKTTELNEKAAQGWQGLSELYHETQQWVKAADADQVLVDLAHRGDAALAAKLPQLVRRLGAAHTAAGQLEEAEVALRDVLANPLPPEEKLSVLAQLADVQLKEDTADLEAKIQQRLQEKWREAGQDANKVCEEAVRSAVMSEAADEALELDCDHATPTLKNIMCSVAPTPPYVKYHDAYLRRLRRAVNVAAPGSMDRHNRRVAVLEVCRAMMEGRCAAEAHIGMGCASPYAYETALRLLEIEEEIAGASLPRTSSAEFTPRGGLRGAGSLASFSAVNSPRSGSGMATPTAAGIQAASQLLSPGSFFGTSLRISTAGSLGAAGALPPLHSGAATPSAASLAGALLPGPATPKRDMSAARLTELVHHPMAAATQAAGATMAAQERESFSQLAAEASTGSTLANTTANGTPGVLTPVGSIVQPASIGPSTNPLAAGSESIGAFGANPSLGRPGGLSVAVASSLAAGGGGMSCYSSAEMLTNASPRWATGGGGTPRTPTHGGVLPAAAPLLMADREMIGRKLVHAFPWNATGQVHLAMALRRREAYVASAAATIKLDCSWQGPNISDLSCGGLAQRLRADRARQAARKAWLADLLAKGLGCGAPVVSGMIGLAELRLEAGDAAGALQAAKQGLKFVYDRSRIGNERARNAALVLNLLAAQALLGTGQLTDAGRIFVRLSQRVSEGEVAFGSEAVGMPATSIRQQAIRGLAQVALAQGDSCQALHHYGELVSKALMGRGSAEHWAYAEYGWLLFQEGNADAGRFQLETALDVLYKQAAVMPGLEGVAAGYHYKLARICWALGGNYRAEQEYCLQHLLDAAAEPGPQQAEAFEWLGHWYGQVAADEFRARKCYQRALALNPTLEGAGNALCDILQARSAKSSSGAASGSATALEQQLLEEMLLRAPDAYWARARLARLQLATGQFEQAVTTYQAAIRSSPKSAELWEGLAASYQSLGRHASALKSYCRSLELDRARPYALMSAGALHYMAGSYQDAAKQYRAALELVPEHPAALLGLAEVLLSSACKHMAMGAAGAAAVELSEAAECARAAVSGAKFAAEHQADSTTAATSRQPLSPSAAIRAAALDTTGEDPSRAAQATAGQGQQAQQLQHLQYSSNLVTAWKLLGDILLQQHMLQGTAAATSSNADSSSAAAAAVTAALQQLAVRRDLLRDARRAYARALALSPTSGELWGDVALCYSHEAKLLQQLQPPQAQQGATAAAIAAARAAAVRTARGGLRLAPVSSWLWGVLANALAAIGDPAAAEYSYSRALALDPTAAMLWVQLGRLYSRHGSAELAEQCYEAARGAEPTLVSVWEAMAATAAARSNSSTGSAAAAAAAEHAVGLGGGPESWLQYATAGLSGRADEGLLLACACKASAHQPLLLPPHAALAAALEARGQYASAVAALQYCLALLQAGLQQGQEGLAALGLTGFGQGSGDATHRVLLLQAAGFDGVEGAVNPDTVRLALELALARNFTLAGQYTEAVHLYERLESQGSLDSNPISPDTYSWICYGYAAQQSGQAGLCSRVLERAIEGAAADTAKLHAVMAMLQHLLSQRSLEAAFSLLLQHLPQLSSSNPCLVQPCANAWLALVAAAAAAGQADLQVQIVEVMRQAAEGQLQHLDMAWVECELKCITAAAQAASGAKPAALRTLSHAVHTCPWHTPAWLRLVDAGLAANPRLATAAYRACPALQPESNTDFGSCSSMQVRLPQHGSAAGGVAAGAASTFSQQLALSEVLAGACSRATALSGQVAAAVVREAGQEVTRLRRLLHALPGSPDVWYCLALAALLQAIGDGQAAHFRRAGKCCLSALNRIDQLIAQQQQQAGPAATSSSASHSSSSRSLLHCSLHELLEVKVRLMVAMSECHQHSRQPGCHESAHQWAMDALGAAMAAGGVGTATAHRQVGRMLALEGMTAQAEMAYRQAVVASGSDSSGAAAGAVLELAKLLAGQGRQQEAVQLLHGIWEGAAASLAAAGSASGGEATATAAAAVGGISGPGPHFVEVAALEEALMLASLRQYDSARAAAAAGLRLATAAGDSAPAAAELVSATVALQAAAAAPADGARNFVLEARWAASSAAKSGMALPGTVGTAAAGIGAAVLAQVELARNKPERAYDAIGMSFGAWVDQAVPAQVLVAAGELTGQVTDCAAAVHTAPWLAEGWEKFKLAAIAAGRLVDLL